MKERWLHTADDTKYLARENVNYYPITKNSDGSVTVDGKTYGESFIGKKAREDGSIYYIDNTNHMVMLHSSNMGGTEEEVKGESIYDSIKYVTFGNQASNSYIGIPDQLAWYKASEIFGGVIRPLLTHLYREFSRLSLPHVEVI